MGAKGAGRLKGPECVGLLSHDPLPDPPPPAQRWHFLPPGSPPDPSSSTPSPAPGLSQLSGTHPPNRLACPWLPSHALSFLVSQALFFLNCPTIQSSKGMKLRMRNPVPKSRLKNPPKSSASGFQPLPAAPQIHHYGLPGDPVFPKPTYLLPTCSDVLVVRGPEPLPG